MRTPALHDEREWPYVLTLLPGDLENSAWQSEALLRCRHIPDAKSWMLARLLAAALAQRLVQPAGALSPWGYELRPERGTRVVPGRASA